MAKNYIQAGDTVTLTAPASVSSGDGVLVGAVFGIAAFDAGSGDEVEVTLTGVWELPKASGQLNEGAAVSWDNSAKNICAPGSGKFPVGACVRLAGTSDATCRVRLSGIPTAAA